MLTGASRLYCGIRTKIGERLDGFNSVSSHGHNSAREASFSILEVKSPDIWLPGPRPKAPWSRTGNNFVRRPLSSTNSRPVHQTAYNPRHRASTSMYSITFRVRVTTPPQYGRNGTAHAAGASMLSPARGVFAGMRSVRVRHACGVRWAWRITAGLCQAFP